MNTELLKVDQRAFKAAQAVVILAAKVLPLHPKRRKHLRREVPEELEVPPDVPLLQAGVQRNRPVAQHPSGRNVQHAEDLCDAPSSSTSLGINCRSDQGPRGKDTDACSSGERQGRQALHSWEALNGNPGTWRCTVCRTVANTGQLLPPSRSGCGGRLGVLSRVGEGHRLIVYPPHPNNPDPTPVYACELCHRSGASRVVFSANCLQDPSRSRTAAYRRLEAGKHPHCRHGSDRLFKAGRYMPLHLLYS